MSPTTERRRRAPRARPQPADGAPRPPRQLPALPRSATGITGLDEILGGGLPTGRPTLVAGGAGCGKTLLAMEFLCHGALHEGEPGVFIAFEEKATELAANAASLGLDLATMEADGLLSIDCVPLDPQAMLETGDYDLEALFIRIAAAVKAVGAKRIAIDTIEVLFGSLHDATIVRAELKRLFTWIKDQGLTAVITAEKGDGAHVSRFGIEAYVSDCVIVLDNRITDERSTRRIRVLKYRGSSHGSDEYPFLISEHGIAVLPITSLGLGQAASRVRVSTGVTHLDRALSGGLYRGSSILISGTAGTAKSTFAATFVDAACRRDERALYIAYEESADQIVRNMDSVGIHLAPWATSGMLRFETVRPTLCGLETHLASLQRLLLDFQPSVVVIDPLTSLTRSGSHSQVVSMLMRVVDMLKSKGITAMFTALTQAHSLEETEVDVSSLVDTRMQTESVVTNGERNRVLSIVKSRGMAHFNQLIEVSLSEHGIDLLEPYVGPGGVLTGSARVFQEQADRIHQEGTAGDLEAGERSLVEQRAEVEAQIAALWARFGTAEAEVQRQRSDMKRGESEASARRALMGSHRWATAEPGAAAPVDRTA